MKFFKKLSPHFHYMSLKFAKTTRNVVPIVNKDFFGRFEKKIFIKISKFFELFCRSGVMKFFKND